MSNMTEYQLHTQGGVIAMSPRHDGRDPMRNRPHSNGTDTTMTIRRYGLGREYAGNTGSPAITEQADGAYVRYEDHQRLQAACEAHNEMLLGRLKLAEGEKPVELQGIAEALENGDGLWRSCSGCHELNEGHDTGPYSEALKCHLGNGCSECGGIGAMWDTTDYQAMADVMAAPVAVQPSVAAAWLLTPRQVIALSEELIAGSQTMGGADDQGEESLLRLMVRMPGTVEDDNGEPNERPVLAFCIDDYPDEGVYPIDPTDCKVNYTEIPNSSNGAQPDHSKDARHMVEVSDEDISDLLSEFGDHHVEDGHIAYDKWTLAEAGRALLKRVQPAGGEDA